MPVGGSGFYVEGVVVDMGTGTVWGGSGKGRGVEKGGYDGSGGGGVVEGVAEGR